MVSYTGLVTFVSLLSADNSFAITKRAIVFRNTDRMNIIPHYFVGSNFTEYVRAGLTTARGEAEIFEKGVKIRKQLNGFVKLLNPAKDVIVAATSYDRTLKSAVAFYSGMFHYPNITSNKDYPAFRYEDVSLPVSIINSVQTIPELGILSTAFANVQEQLIARNDSLYKDAQSFIDEMYKMGVLAESAVDHTFDLTEAEFIIAEVVATRGQPNSKTQVPPQLLQDLTVHLHVYLIRVIDEVAKLYGGRDVVCSHIRDALSYFLNSRFSLVIFNAQDFNMYVIRLCYGHLNSYALPGKGFLFTIKNIDKIAVQSI